MPVSVRAEVVDIRSDTPRDTDVFLVDTNVWIHLYYPRASQVPDVGPPSHDATHYPPYFKKVLEAKSSLKHTGLNFSELAHNIERIEREIYSAQCGRKIAPKEFRHSYERQRIQVMQHVSEMWKNVCAVSTLLPLNISQPLLDASFALLRRRPVDGYDAYMIEGAKRASITNIITDDSDFSTVPGLLIFTANQAVIDAARVAKKLITR